MTCRYVTATKTFAITMCLCSSLAYADTPLAQPELRKKAVHIISQLRASNGKALIVLKDGTVHTAHTPREQAASLRLDSCQKSTWIGPGNYSVIVDATILTPGEGSYAHAAARHHVQCLEAGKAAAEQSNKTLLWGVLGGLALLLLL